MAHAPVTWTAPPTAVRHFSFLDELPLAAEAFEFMAERHASQVRKADSAPFLLHPLEVGALLHVARLRRQVASAGSEAAAIFAADKLSKVREIRIRAACDARVTGDPTWRLKLDHYLASSRMLEQQLGAHPVVKALAFELEALHALPPAARA